MVVLLTLVDFRGQRARKEFSKQLEEARERLKAREVQRRKTDLQQQHNLAPGTHISRTHTFSSDGSQSPLDTSSASNSSNPVFRAHLNGPVNHAFPKEFRDHLRLHFVPLLAPIQDPPRGVFVPKLVKRYYHHGVQVRRLMHGSPKRVVEKAEQGSVEELSWNKYCQIFFRDNSVSRSFEASTIRKSLLMLPREINSHAVNANKILVKVVVEEVDARVLFEAVNFILDLVRTLDRAGSQQEGLTMRDEVFCQLLRMTQDNPNQ